MPTTTLPKQPTIIRVSTGIRGPKGEDSTIAGPRGPEGIQGPAGPRGLQGIQGEPGRDGSTPELPDSLVHTTDPRLVNALDASKHAALRTLNHWAANGPYESYSAALLDVEEALFPTHATWFADPTRTRRIMREDVEYNTNGTIKQHTFTLYNDAGDVIVTATDRINYVGFLEVGRLRLVS